MFKRTILNIFIICIIFSLITVNGEKMAGVIYSFTEEEYKWGGENENLDYVSYDVEEEAYKCTLYNVTWASRFGGVSLQGNELELPVSATKNRFFKMMVKVDEVGSENALDRFQVLFWYKGNASVVYASVPQNTLTPLSGSDGNYITVTFDLGWTNAEEKILDKFRMDMFTTSINKAANGIDGGICGYMWIKYIAFFDTQEEADAYEMVIPTEAPATPTPEATESVATQKPSTPTPKPITNNGKTKDKTPMVLIGAIVVLALVAVVLIVFIPKGRKKHE